MNNNKKPLPPIIEDWLAAMNNEKTNIWIRDNYCQMLENLSTRCSDEVTKFKINKNKLLTAQEILKNRR